MSGYSSIDRIFNSIMFVMLVWLMVDTYHILSYVSQKPIPTRSYRGETVEVNDTPIPIEGFGIKKLKTIIGCKSS